MESILLSISVALGVGLLMSRIVKRFGLPAITGYLIGGVLIGPYFLGRLQIPGIGFTSMEKVEELKVISEITLGFIAFLIGNEFRISQLRKTGKQALVIGVFQALTATLVVDIVLFIIYLIMPDIISLSAVITLGAIATATAPAATLMVINQYEAKGKLTDILLPVVAIDDAVGLIIFAISLGIAKVISTGEYNLLTIIVEPIVEIILSLLIGIIIGTILTKSENHFKSRSKRMSVIVAVVLLSVSISMYHFTFAGIHISISSLLLCMMVGTAFCNESEYDFSNDLMDRTNRWATPFMILFFILSGSELQLDVFTNITIVLIGIAFIAARTIGKYYGAYFSAKAVKCDKSVQKYLGITLLPQAGVALGMSIKAQEALGNDGNLIKNITLFAILIYELVGPYLTKQALIKSGDIVPKESITNKIRTYKKTNEKKHV
ncbi:MAG: cation:proton antiporter [Bacilli bacterium]|nr:cation:proton antiporter [Bacilli bacterium]